MKASAVVLLAGMLCAHPNHGKALELFLSPTGNDANAGTEAKPFKSFERARAAVRSLKGDQDVVVWLRGGVYEREHPFEWTAEDSGSPQHPVVWRSRPGEEVRIVGGKVVTGWKPVTDKAVLERLAPEARGKAVQADLKALGITAYGQVKGGGLELFFDDKPMNGGSSFAEFSLDGGLAKATRFKATMGVEDTVKDRGSVIFQLYVRRDGSWQQVYASDILRGGREVGEVDVGIAGADALRLAVTDAGDPIKEASLKRVTMVIRKVRSHVV